MLRVLSLPGRNYHGGNRYFLLFCDALAQSGIEVVDIRSRSAARLAYDIVHVHFPEHYVTEQDFFGAIKWTSIYVTLFIISKLFGKKLVWSVHDVHPFKRRHAWLLGPYMRLFRSLVTAHVFLNRSSQAEFYEAFPDQFGKPFTIIPHGPYPTTIASALAISQLRHELTGGQSCLLVGILGGIKKYKNVEIVRRIPYNLPSGKPIRVLIAGQADRETKPILTDLCGTLPSSFIVRKDSMIDDSELDLLIQACDCVLLPYERGWNSGMAMLVLSNGGRIVGSPLPVFKELASTFQSPWLYTYDDESMIGSTLETLESESISSNDQESLSNILEDMSFQNGARKLKPFYEKIIGATSS